MKSRLIVFDHYGFASVIDKLLNLKIFVDDCIIIRGSSNCYYVNPDLLFKYGLFVAKRDPIFEETFFLHILLAFGLFIEIDISSWLFDKILRVLHYIQPI